MNRYRPSRIIATLLSVVIVALTIGCSNGPPMAEVSGQITANGQPVKEAGITFSPVDGGRPAWATTDQEGRFVLTTFSAEDGALVGNHIVTVAERDTDVPEIPKQADPDAGSLFAEMPTKPRSKRKGGVINQSYASRSTSDLRFTVEAGEQNTADFDLTN